jgi:WD40 repeat protein
MERCTTLESITKYKFDVDGHIFYYDLKNKTITKSRFGNVLYMYEDNHIFLSGKFHKVKTNDEIDLIQTFNLGPITRKNLKYHNIIAELQFVN